MNDGEIERVMKAMADHNHPVKLGLLAKAALSEELPDMEFGVVFDRLVQAAKHERFLSPSHILQLEKPKPAGKYDAADAAWNHINELAKQGDGLLGLIANIDSIEWSDPKARQALLDARQTLRTTNAENALWEFRKAYNRLNDEGDSNAPTVGQLAAPKPRPQLREPTVDPETAGSEAKRMLAEMRRKLQQPNQPDAEPVVEVPV